ncbi:MAG: LptF/LptG family permease [Candidatus Marinimicrobia bacterium]|nr:LptF/LptG family permease [Candidatus Neomarinimicrobiota bacterium]
MKKLDIYIISQFILILGASIIAFLMIFIIVDAVENLDRFIDSSVPLKIISTYYLFSIPWFVNIGLPMAVLIATIFTVGLFSRRNELTAMKSSGISMYRIAAPLILCSLIISIGSFFFEDKLVTSGNLKRRNIEREYLGRTKSKDYRERRRNIFLQKSERFHIAIERYHSKYNKATGVAMQFLEKGKLVKRIDAKWMKWNADVERWNIHAFAIREFDSDGFETNVTISEKDTLLFIEFTPEDISQEAISPEERNYTQLKGFIIELKNNGVDTTRWEVNLHYKISFAFTNLIVVLFALPLVASKLKGGLAFGAGMSVFVIFSYYAFIRFGQTLGFKGVLDPFLSAWLGNVVFSIGGIFMLIFIRK